MSFREGSWSDRLGREAYRRLSFGGIEPLSKELPWFPDGSVPPIPGGLHDAERWATGVCFKPAFCLPSVLVPPMRYLCRSSACWQQIDSLRPYWLGPMIVTNDGDPLPDQEFWRTATLAEILAAAAQHPEVGSLRCADQIWDSEYLCIDDGFFDGPHTIQVYFWRNCERFVADVHGSGRYHRRAWVRRRSSGEPFPFCEHKRC